MESPQSQASPEARLHFLDYWRIIRIRKAIILTVFLITAIIATAVTFILPVSYSSTAQINIEPDTASDISPMNGMREERLPFTTPIFFRPSRKFSKDRWFWAG